MDKKNRTTKDNCPICNNGKFRLVKLPVEHLIKKIVLGNPEVEQYKVVWTGTVM